MILGRSFLKKGDGRIILHGTVHLSKSDIYNPMAKLIRSCQERDYIVVRESVQFWMIENLESQPRGVQNVVNFFKLWLKMMRESYKVSRPHREPENLPINNGQINIDAPALEYASRLYEAGFNPDVELIRFLWDNIKPKRVDTLAAYDLCADSRILQLKNQAGSWEELEKQVADQFWLIRKLDGPMVWREEFIINSVLKELEERDKNKALLLYGDYHIDGFRKILLNLGWQDVYSKITIPRS